MTQTSTGTPVSNGFLSSFHDVARIGATENNGVHRQAATEEDRQMRDWFVAFAERHGWTVTVDHIGNVFARVPLVSGGGGQVPSDELASAGRSDQSFVLVGSHLDSQPFGGRFDGAYGVIAALHAAADIEDRVRAGEVQATHDLMVVDWFNEEGGRFAPSLMGSAVYAGLMDQKEMVHVMDLDGVTVGEALAAIGYLGQGAGPRQVAGYAEIHIEQGRILEREGLALGAVDSSWYTQKLNIEVVGEQSHTGATAMADRRDALVGAAKVILLVREICDEFPAESLVSSVGQMTVEPNSPIVVNSQVHMIADLRANNPTIVKEARDRLLERFAEVASELDMEIRAEDFDIRPNRYYPEEGVELQEKVAANLGLGIRRMQSMAGHDSVSVNTMAPSVMMFIPSVDGVSHCEREYTSDEDMVTGLQALTDVLAEMVAGALDGVSYPGQGPDPDSEASP